MDSIWCIILKTGNGRPKLLKQLAQVAPPIYVAPDAFNSTVATELFKVIRDGRLRSLMPVGSLIFMHDQLYYVFCALSCSVIYTE